MKDRIISLIVIIANILLSVGSGGYAIFLATNNDKTIAFYGGLAIASGLSALFLAVASN